MTIKKVDYGSHASLVSALQGQDALIITLAVTAPHDQQTKLISAAAEAGVSWILPNEWGSDTAHPQFDKIQAMASKRQYRDQIQGTGKSAWIGVVNNQWYEYSLAGGHYGINIKNRTASFFDGGEQKTVTTAMPQVGRAVASLLSLPVSGTSPCLSDYKNKHVYISSFYISQREMLSSVQRVTGTEDGNWKISHRNAEQTVKEGFERMAKGDWMGFVDVLYGNNFVKESGNDYVITKGTANKALGLPEERLDEVTKEAVKEAEAK